MPAPKPNLVLPALFVGGLVAAGTYQVGRIIRPNVDNGAAPVPVDNSQGSMVLRGWGEITGQQLRPLNDIWADAIRESLAPNNPDNPASTYVTGRIAMDAVLSPQDAYNAVKAGKIAWVKTQKISQYFSWGEVLSSATQMSLDGFKGMPLSAYQAAAKHAKNLDSFRVAVGHSLSINSWYRSKEAQIAIYRGIYGRNYPINKIPLNSRHIYGDATDFNGTYSQKRKYEQIAINLGWPNKTGGMGYARNPNNPRFHLDSRGGPVKPWRYD